MRAISNEWGKRWDHTLDVKDLWAEHRDLDTDMDCFHLAEQLVKRIKGAAFYGAYEDQEELEAICQAFEGLTHWAEHEDFNPIFARLYDWCDRGKRVWVKTDF